VFPDETSSGFLDIYHNGHLYATAHVHDVDCHYHVEDGETPVGIDADFEVAPGDASDVQVANLYGWGCVGLVFGDHMASCPTQPWTSLGTSLTMVWRALCSMEFLQRYLTLKTGVKFGNGDALHRDGEGRVSSNHKNGDILLRKKALLSHFF
jgi:hypothetical protein